MSRLTEALRKLGNKLTGKSTVQSNNFATILDDIANDYKAPLPAYPTTTDNKTYVLKLVDGVLTWVEETTSDETPSDESTNNS